MVYVRLAQDWTDNGGAAHTAGDMVDIDAVTLAELEADGVVASTEKLDDEPLKWPGATTSKPGDEVRPAAWPGATTPKPGDEVRPAAWPGATTPKPTAPTPELHDV
jgi:hypothetical protein